MNQKNSEHSKLERRPPSRAVVRLLPIRSKGGWEDLSRRNRLDFQAIRIRWDINCYLKDILEAEKARHATSKN